MNHWLVEGGCNVGMRLYGFASGSDALLPEHRRWIDTIFVPQIKQYPNAWIDLLGYTSKSGSEQSNIAVSRRRINSVERYIKLKYPGIRINLRIPDGKNVVSGEEYLRAVLIRWYGIPNQSITGPATPPPVEVSGVKYRSRKKAPEGCWCIIGVDSFGIPIKAGVAGGKVDITLLNDKGERHIIHGWGVGIGLGVEFDPKKPAEEAAKVVTKGAKAFLVKYAKEGGALIGKSIFEMGIKPGDLQNVCEKMQALKIVGPNETAGGVFRRSTWKANLSIHDINRFGYFAIGSTEAQFIVMGGEVGFISFGGNAAFGSPWGFYLGAGLATFKGGLGLSATIYVISNTETKLPLPSNELGTEEDSY